MGVRLEVGVLENPHQKKKEKEKKEKKKVHSPPAKKPGRKPGFALGSGSRLLRVRVRPVIPKRMFQPTGGGWGL